LDDRCWECIFGSSHTRKAIVAGPEIGCREGNILIIHREVYGLKSFRTMLAGKV